MSTLNNLKLSILGFLLLLCHYGIFSQNNQPRIKYYTLDDGLSQVTVNDLLMDSSGLVWVATEDGLNRFDGNEFRHFKYSESDTSSISGNVLNKLSEDKDGNIWVGTIGNGLNYYDRYKDSFRRIKLEYANDTETVSDILTEDDGTIWVTTRASGLHRLQPKGEGFYLNKNYLSDQRLGAISKDKKGQLWVGGFTGEIYMLNTIESTSAITEMQIRVKGHIQAFYHTEDQLLIGSDYGLFIYDLVSKEVRLFELEKEESHPTKHVVAFLRENDSKVWIGTGNGLYLLDLEKMEVNQKIVYQEDSTEGLSTNTVYALLRMSQKQILAGTAGYLNLLDFSEPYFKNISKKGRGQQVLNDNVVFSVLKEGKDLWIGTADGGLNLIRNRKSYHFLENIDDPQSISGSSILDIILDKKKNRLWLATTRGLSMLDLETFDPEHPKFTIYHHDPTDSTSINMDYVTSLALDKNGNLWGGTSGNGIFRVYIDKDGKDKFLQYKRNSNGLNSLPNDFIMCIRVDEENNIWLGTEGGLSKLKFTSDDYEQPNFTNYVKTPGQKKSLSNNSVLDILIDTKKRIWVGTRHGLNLFLGNNEFESWTEQNQFPNAVVFNIQDDESGNLWMGTNDGMTLFNPDTKSFKRYGLKDGIKINEFNTGSKFRDKEGTIYLGGIGGITYFIPEDLKNIDKLQTLYFSELRIKDKIINTQNTPNKILGQSLVNTNTLEFKNDQFPFYLQFSSIDFRMNKKVEFGYKLLPNDEEWNMLNDPEIQFLSLPAGNHTLLVNGFSRGEIWAQEPLKMNLTILPPWWSTIWAYALYLGIIAALGYYFYHFQLSRKLAVAESVRLKEVSELKSGLYTNITHEFRTPLTVILGMTQNLKKNLKNTISDADKNSLTMIERNGENLLDMVNEMLNLAKIESGSMKLNRVQTDVIPFVKYVSESFHSLAEAKKVSLTVYSEIDALQMDIDVNKMASIISNLLSNAIKFTEPHGKIIVHLNKIKVKSTNYFSIKVQDNGLGITEEGLTHLFDRFYQVNSTSTKQEGTGIGLSLTKEFVELMNGTISVESSFSKGSVFKVQIPVTNVADKIVEAKRTTAPLIKESRPQIQKETVLDEQNTELPLVLLIEDNLDVAHYLETCLKANYQTVHASDGILGIEMAFEKIPDIIISDVMMPRKDGFEVCATLKADERTDHIPIILLTAKVTPEDRLTGLTHGADAYLAKPFNQNELFTRLDQLILVRKKLIHKLEKNGLSFVLKEKVDHPQTKFLKQVIESIHAHLDDANFGPTQLAKEMSLSESQIYRKLKSITDKSTAIFIRSVRLQKAKELIETTDKTISEIAYQVGFNDPSWFSRAFKKEFGFAPSDANK